MNDLTTSSIEFFDREANFAFSVACGLLMEKRDDEAREAFRQSVRLTRRAQQERARQFSEITNPKQR